MNKGCHRVILALPVHDRLQLCHLPLYRLLWIIKQGIKQSAELHAIHLLRVNHESCTVMCHSNGTTVLINVSRAANNQWNTMKQRFIDG